VININQTNSQLSLNIPNDHACFADHFPGNPLVPGALLLKWVIGIVETNIGCKVVLIKQFKFLQIVQPGDELGIEILGGANPRQKAVNIFNKNLLVMKGVVELDHKEPCHD
jgi:3-hydroxyacyl-[acyl-carrier-protein] dehydratase